MPLFHIQDNECPKWVVALNYANAVEKWKKKMAEENAPYDISEIEEPQGVSYICDDEDLIIADSMPWPKL